MSTSACLSWASVGQRGPLVGQRGPATDATYINSWLACRTKALPPARATLLGAGAVMTASDTGGRRSPSSPASKYVPDRRARIGAALEIWRRRKQRDRRRRRLPKSRRRRRKQRRRLSSKRHRQRLQQQRAQLLSRLSMAMACSLVQQQQQQQRQRRRLSFRLSRRPSLRLSLRLSLRRLEKCRTGYRQAIGHQMVQRLLTMRRSCGR